MVTSLLECKTIIVTGATSGIGRGIALRLLDRYPDVKLIVTGRRKQNLEEIVTKYGSSRVAAIPFDVSDIANISKLAKSAIACFDGTLDGVILNAGMQRGFQFADPNAAISVDFEAFRMELDVNYTSQVALTQHLLPHLIAIAKSGKPASINFVTTSLSLVPSKRGLNYSASKAAMHSFILCLRGQVDDFNRTGGGAKLLGVTEIMPPLVETELHDAKHQPDLAFDVKGHPPAAMTLEVFLDGVWEGWSREGGPADEILVGAHTRSSWESVDRPRKEILAKMWSKQF
ncbi:unnamed protein product [Calypogeia fissa]